MPDWPYDAYTQQEHEDSPAECTFDAAHALTRIIDRLAMAVPSPERDQALIAAFLCWEHPLENHIGNPVQHRSKEPRRRIGAYRRFRRV